MNLNCNIENIEGRVLCKLTIDISRKSYDSYDSQYLSKKVLLTVNIKSNYEKHVSYLNVNNLNDGIIVGDQFQYYYANIRQYDHGSIALNNKKGLGLMYARIINKDTIDENGNGMGEFIYYIKMKLNIAMIALFMILIQMKLFLLKRYSEL